MNKVYLLILINLLLLLSSAASKLRKTAQAAWQMLISLVINLLRIAKSYLSINNLKAVLSLANIKKSSKWLFALLVLIILLHKGVEIVQTILAGQRISIEQLKFLMEMAGLILYF